MSDLKNRTGQDRTGQDRTGQGRAGQDRTGQDRTGLDRTGQDRTGQDRTGQDRTGRELEKTASLCTLYIFLHTNKYTKESKSFMTGSKSGSSFAGGERGGRGLPSRIHFLADLHLLVQENDRI